MNRIEACRFSCRPHNYKTAIISIYSTYSYPNNIQITSDNVTKVTFLCFDDEEDGDMAITMSDAKQIASFVNRVKNDVRKIIVHCDAGVSRSAGVAAAIMKYLFNNDDYIFNNNKYRPNMRCYRYVLNALFDKEGDESNETLC